MPTRARVDRRRPANFPYVRSKQSSVRFGARGRTTWNITRRNGAKHPDNAPSTSWTQARHSDHHSSTTIRQVTNTPFMPLEPEPSSAWAKAVGVPAAKHRRLEIPIGGLGASWA
jgi:hypothetical protein